MHRTTHSLEVWRERRMERVEGKSYLFIPLSLDIMSINPCSAGVEGHYKSRFLIPRSGHWVLMKGSWGGVTLSFSCALKTHWTRINFVVLSSFLHSSYTIVCLISVQFGYLHPRWSLCHVYSQRNSGGPYIILFMASPGNVKQLVKA